MELENPLYSFAVGDFSYREGFVNGAASFGDDQPRKDLDTLLAALSNMGVYFYTVAYVEIGDVLLELLLFDFLDDVHGSDE